MVLPKDPIKREEALKNIRLAAQKRSQNKEWLENVRKASIKTHSDPEWIRKHQEGIDRRSQNGEWLKNITEKNKELAQDPEWLRKNKEGCIKRNDNVEWRGKVGKWNKGKSKTEEFKQHLSIMNSGENNPFYGKHHEPGKLAGENNGMFDKKHSEETKEQMRLSHLGKMRGADNPTWNGGITPLRKAVRESSEMYEWKKKVMERDGYKDIYTGEVGYLEVHHKTPFEELLRKYNIQTLEDARNCKELWDVDNGETMLKRNHRKYHGLVGEDEGE